MGNEDRSLAPFRKFRRAAVRVALMLTGIVALAAYGFSGMVAAQGVLLGGLAGSLSFWVMAVRLEKAVTIPRQKVKLAPFGWTAFRLGLYGIVLAKAYTLDPESMHGLMGAVAGILTIHAAQVFLGLTGLDLGETGRAKREEQQQ